MSLERKDGGKAYITDYVASVLRSDGVFVEGSIARVGHEIDLFSVNLYDPSGGITVAMYDPSEVVLLGNGEFDAGTRRILLAYTNSSLPPEELFFTGKLLKDRINKLQKSNKGK